MKIGIDISQIVHEGTGVGQYVRELVKALVRTDGTHEYVLFGASLRKRHIFYEYVSLLTRDSRNQSSLDSGNRPLSKRVKLVMIPIPPTILEFLWNRLHIVPIEWFVGSVDVFWSSDWTQPPLAQAKGITTVHDVSFLRFPKTFAKMIIDVQKRRLALVKQECQAILCDSEATKKDVVELLHLPESKLHVVYPGFMGSK